MDWQYLRPKCAKSSVAALAFSALIHFTSPVHFVLASAALILSWPVTDIIIESISAKNPDAGERVIIKSWWPIAIQWLLLIAVSVGVYYWQSLPFMTAFAYTLLVLAPVAAVNGIVIEVEDNAPGGWLNPNGRK